MSTDTGPDLRRPSPSAPHPVSRTLTRQHTRAHWVPLTLAAALATVLVLAGTSWIAGRAGESGLVPTVDTDPGEVAVVAYAVADTGAGPRLVADRRVVPALSSSLRAALVQTLRGTPVGGNYDAVWPDAPEMALDVSVEGDLVTVDLRLGDDGAGATGDVSPLLGQAVAWTVATAVGDPYVVTELTVDGGPPSALLPGVDGPLRPARSADVLAPVTVESVGDGDEVQGSVVVSGLAATFEGTVTWHLLRDGRVVDEGFTTAQECCVPSPYAFELDAPPGRYTLRVGETDPSGGEGVPPYSDKLALEIR